MKSLYKKKKLITLLKEYPLVYIYCSEKINSNILIKNNIKNIKFKNSLLKGYNKDLFNGNILLIYGVNVQKNLKELKNIIGIFCLNNKKISYIITFNKFLNILIYLKKDLKYINLLNLFEGPLFWFLLKL